MSKEKKNTNEPQPKQKAPQPAQSLDVARYDWKQRVDPKRGKTKTKKEG